MPTPGGSAPPRRFDLLAVGNACLDVVVHAAGLPAWDDKVLGSSWRMFAGGTEANVACAASRLGLRCAAFGQVGADAHGELLLGAFAEAGVDTAHVRRPEDATSALALVLVSPEGERSVVYVPAEAPSAARADAAEALQASRMLYTMPYDAAALAAWAALAREAGTEVAIDVERAVAADAAHLQRLMAACDIAFFNEAGFRAGTGLAPDPQALQDLLGRSRAHTVVVSLGARGAMAADARGWAKQPAFAAEVVDTTGAGDTFNAAFLAARFGGAGLHECLAHGCAAASRTIQSVGARPGMPLPREVDEVRRSQPLAAAVYAPRGDAAC